MRIPLAVAGLFSLVLLPFSASRAELTITDAVSVPFAIETEALCFGNGEPDYRRFGPLGKYGATHGTCQGIAGTSSAFIRNAKFDPSAKKPASEEEARKLVRRVIRLHKGDCSGRETIPGYSSLTEFCADFRNVFLKETMDYNASIAVREIVPVLPRFLLARGVIKSQGDRLHVWKTLESFRKSLAAGRAPILLLYPHAIMVHVMHYVRDNDRVLQARLDVYDSNDYYDSEMTIGFDPRDGLPSLGETMVWNITPDRPERRGTPRCSR